MAIAKTYLGGDPAEVQAFLSSTGMFGSVTRNSNVITCKNSDNATVLTVAKTDDYTWRFTAALTGSHTWEKTYESHGLNYGYKCANGAFLVLNYLSQENKYSVMITKNNDGKVSFVFPDSYSNRSYVCCLTYSDTFPVTYYTVAQSVAEQTVLSPFITNAPAGTTSYTPDAFYMPFGAYVGRGYAKFTMNGKMYLTDGYWVLSDGNVQT